MKNSRFGTAGYSMSVTQNGYYAKAWQRATKLLMIMKLVIALITVACLQVSAKGSAQTVTLSAEKMALPDIFKAIEKQTGFLIAYHSSVTEEAPLISVRFQGTPLKEALDICARIYPFEYKFMDRNIIITRITNERKIDSSVFYSKPKKRIKGKVSTVQGESLGGANVTVKRTGNGTITNAKGEFTLEVQNEDILIMSFVGYQTKEVKVGEAINLFIITDIATDPLDKVVVQAYGTTSQRLSTGSIAKVTAEEISKQPVINPLQALQGRVAGLIVSQTSGYASSPFKVEIRGRNAIDMNFTSDPLYVIDGVPLTVLNVGGNSNYNEGSSGFIQNGFPGPAGGQSPFFNINPKEIESIEVLKDADATAIYGSRASNGVIIITTKKGIAGKTKFDFSIYQGVSKVTRFWNMLSTKQYLEVRREAFKNDYNTYGEIPGFTVPDEGNAYDLLLWDTTVNLDWQKILWNEPGKNTNVQGSLSGGDARTSFRIGAGYNHMTNILTSQGGDKQGSLSFNLNHRNINQKLNIGLTAGYSFSESNMINFPSSVNTLIPNAPNIFDSSGKLNYAGWEPVRYQFPFGGLLQPYDSKTNFLNTNLSISYEVFRSLILKSTLGYNSSQNTQQSFSPIISQDPIDLPKGSSQFGNNMNKNIIVEPQLEHSRRLSKGRLNVLIGGSIQNTTTEGTYATGSQYSSDALLRSISNAPVRSVSAKFGEYKYAALFTRINFVWDNRYVINLSGRRDGSSTFGEDKQFGNFGSIGAAWILSEEKIIKSHFKFINFAKVRGSYGTTGGEGPNYGYLSRWTSTNPNFTYSGILPLIPTQHANPDYQWQVNRKLEGAIELNLFKDKFNFIFAYYRNRCNNQLVPFPLPDYTGFPTVIANSPASVQNEGFEFTLGAKLIKTKNVNWIINFNLGINRNKLLEYPNLPSSPYASTLVIGQSINIKKLLHFSGVDTQTGLYTFEDRNKDGNIIRSVTDTANDLFIYNFSPKFSGGFGTNLSFKQFSVNLFFNYIKQKGTNGLVGLFPGTIQNSPTSVLSRWQKPGDVSNVARFTTQPDITDGNFSSFSDGVYTDASYIRLQNVSISYTIPQKLSSKAGIQNSSIFIQAQNLFVITKYKGIDPETQNFGTIPPSKCITAGISFNF